MSEPIKVGDLVQVVRNSPCGCPSRVMGHIFVVERIANVEGVCDYCNCHTSGPYVVMNESRMLCVALHRLKRIPPLEELEREKLVEKLRELI